jgi:hypothetical protein
VGFPIRTSADQRLLATPRGFSQRATSFIASWCQGIHQMLLLRLRSGNHAQDEGRPGRVPAHTITRSATRPPGRGPTAWHRHATEPSQQCQRAETAPRARQHQCRRAGPEDGWNHVSRRDMRGGGERDRTDDLLLAKQALSQLSYAPGTAAHDHPDGPEHSRSSGRWWAEQDLNLRPHAYQACALTS